MGGYEGADHWNGAAHPLSMNEANHHWQRLAADYDLLAPLGIRTVRESVGWRITESQGEAGWQRLKSHAQLAARQGVQVIWTLMHYGWPADLDLLSPAFVTRFAAFSHKVAATLRSVSREVRVYQPVNEISFLAWALTNRGFIRHPLHATPMAEAHAIKCQLVRAALRACEAIKRADPLARFLHCDPIMHVAAPPDAPPELAERARRQSGHALDAWDMLYGRLEPQLGGTPEHLDIVGINYYHDNQLDLLSGQPLSWHLGDVRRKPLGELLAAVWQRYRQPLVLAETSHVGSGRAQWLDDVAREVSRCRQRGVPLHGVCLYPLIDRHGWDDFSHWHHSGLWDVALPSCQDVPAADPQGAAGATGFFERTLCEPYGRQLRQWQRHLPDAPDAPDAPGSSDASGASGGLRPAAEISSLFPSHPSGGYDMPTIIVFSHLRWNFVYQRPQHLLSRLAAQYRIIFMEEPVSNAAEDYLEHLKPAPNVEVLRPRLTGSASGFHDDLLPVLKSQLARFIRQQGIDDYLVWFYTPMALPLAAELQPRAVIYDCMDELSAFKNAPRQLIQRENALYQQADLVLTGGPSLYRSKRERHPNVHCFSSSVDAAHFAAVPTADGAPQDHPAQASLPRPRLGYCGVIDERIDLALIAALADAHPEWQLVMVGPVVKIELAQLPRRANIHWLGQQSYEDLPQFMAGWDVCLLPFALNESTRFISPTKTLEYMAAGQPCVSTRIRDVAEPYSHVVAIADSAPEFIRACEALLAESPEHKAGRAEVMKDLVSRTSWDATAQAIHGLIQGLPKRAPAKPAQARSAPLKGEGTALAGHEWQRAEAPRYSTVVLGAGPTGLAASYHLGEGSLLLEKGQTVGGWCRSIVDKGFTFDYAGHIMFSNDPYVLDLYEKLLGKNMHWQNREAWIYSKEVYTRYPFQGALYGLPPDVLKECLIGAIEARFGPLKKEPPGTPISAPSAATATLAAAAGRSPVSAGIAKGAGASPALSAASAPSEPRNFEEFIYKVWGAGVAKHFAIPYNRKLWAVPLDEMETSWLGGRVPLPDLEEMIDGALRPVTKPMGPNARFGYPLRGGFQALMDGFLPLLEGDVEMQADVVAVSPSRRTVTLKDGRSYRYDTLISTLALPKLVEAMGDEAPAAVQAAAQGLRHVSVRCVNLGIGRENLTDKHWIYYPEETVFHRIFVQGNASPYCNAPGGFGLTCEITYSEYKPLPCDGQTLIDRCISDCIKVGMITEDDVIRAANQVDMPYAYVVYDHDRARHVETIRNWVAKANILLAGRYSEWEYYNSDHAFVAGKKAAAQAQVLNESFTQQAIPAQAGGRFPAA
ncbi:MAG: glycosyltransferase [Pseudomonadota bacterium]|nr:glycosyltransferase [Pseudomonadota bacterium]